MLCTYSGTQYASLARHRALIRPVHRGGSSIGGIENGDKGARRAVQQAYPTSKLALLGRLGGSGRARNGRTKGFALSKHHGLGSSLSRLFVLEKDARVVRKRHGGHVVIHAGGTSLQGHGQATCCAVV
jgi:hypothetical protein